VGQDVYENIMDIRRAEAGGMLMDVDEYSQEQPLRTASAAYKLLELGITDPDQVRDCILFNEKTGSKAHLDLHRAYVWLRDILKDYCGVIGKAMASPFSVGHVQLSDAIKWWLRGLPQEEKQLWETKLLTEVSSLLRTAHRSVSVDNGMTEHCRQGSGDVICM
jgi:hypothetical protein